MARLAVAHGAEVIVLTPAPYMVGTAVEPGEPFAAVLVDVPTELGGDRYLVANRLEHFADQHLIGKGSVGSAVSKKVMPDASAL